MLIQELEKIFNIWALYSFKKHFFYIYFEGLFIRGQQA